MSLKLLHGGAVGRARQFNCHLPAVPKHHNQVLPLKGDVFWNVYASKDFRFK